MKTRRATLEDLNEIIVMLVDFANEQPTEAIQNPKYDLWTVQNQIGFYMHRGEVFLSETNDGEITGMIMAAYQPDLWLKDVVWLKEIAWWVKPEYRRGTAGGRLLKRLERVAQERMSRGDIQGLVMTTLSNSPIPSLERHGYQPVESAWVLNPEGV